MSPSSTWTYAACAVLGMLSYACAKKPTLRQPVGETFVTSAEATGADASGYVPPATELYLAEQLPNPCGVDQLPYIEFEFGSSTLSDAQENTLSRTAKCLTTKPFDSTRLILVGRADPIGSTTYNLALAYDRAANVSRSTRRARDRSCAHSDHLCR